MHILSGYYQQEGGSLERGRMMIEMRDGLAYDAQTNGLLCAKTYAVAKGVTGVKVTSDRDCYTFLPDDGECERVGLATTGAGGRPAMLTDGKRKQVYLDSASIAAAVALSPTGNVSEGIRIALSATPRNPDYR